MDPRIIKLACPHCGAALEINPDLPEQFACGYCGAAVLIQRRGGTIALSEIGKGIERVRESTDRTAAELALQRYQGELAALRVQIESRSKDLERAGSSYGCALVLFVCGVLAISRGWLGFVLVILGLVVGYAAHEEDGRRRKELEGLKKEAGELEARIAEKKRIADG